MKKLTREQVIKDLKALIAGNSRMDKFMRMLALRWADESKYEDPNEYIAVYRKELKRTMPYVKVVAFTKRPFGFKLELGHNIIHHYAQLDRAYMVTGYKCTRA